MSSAELKEARRKLEIDLGISSQYLNLEGLDVFADLKEGASFLRKYVDILESPLSESGQEVCFILAEEERESLDDEAYEWFENIINDLTLSDRMNFIFESDLQYGDSLTLIKRSKKAHCSNKVGPKTNDFIKNLFGT